MEKLHSIAAAFVFLLCSLEGDRLTNAMAQFHPHIHYGKRELIPLDVDDEAFRVERKSKFCGKRLTNTLKHICNGRYNAMIKKSGELIGAGEDIWLDYETSTFPFRSRQLSKVLIPGTFKRQTRGIVEECCKKSCSYAEMAGYCGP